MTKDLSRIDLISNSMQKHKMVIMQWLQKNYKPQEMQSINKMAEGKEEFEKTGKDGDGSFDESTQAK